MADTDTAVLEPETTDATLETDDTTAADLETEGSEGSPETGDESSISREEHEAQLAEARKQVEAELRERAEDDAREQAAKTRRTEAVKLRQQTGLAALANIAQWAHKQGENGEDARLNPQVLNEFLGRVEGSVFQEQSDLHGEAFDAYLAKNHKDFKPSRDVQQRLTRAIRDWQPNDIVEAQFDALREAARSDPKLREEVEAEVREELKTQSQRQADKQRPKGPTAVSGGTQTSGPRLDTSDAVAEAYNAGRITGKQYAELMAKHGVRV